jgi:hypothetical protein
MPRQISGFPAWRDLYRITAPAEVERMVHSNPFLEQILLSAPGEIAARFGENTAIELGVFADPDDDGDAQLILTVRSDLDPETALARLHRVEDEWWLGGWWWRTCSLPSTPDLIDAVRLGRLLDPGWPVGGRGGRSGNHPPASFTR